MRGLVMTGGDRRPFSLIAWFVNERSCADELITTTRNHQSLQMSSPAISRSMSRGLRRTARPIETGGIVPDAIRRLTVRTETLRIAAVSPTVMSGSRREPLPAAPYCLLPDGCSLTASASRSDDGRVPQSFRSSRLRLFELERWLGQTPAAAQEGISGDGIVDLYFDRPGINS